MDSAPIKIAASLRSADWMRLGEELRALERAGIDLIHCDASDGVMAPDLGVGPSLVSLLRQRTALPIEIHLMVSRPERFVPLFLDAGADILLLPVENGAGMFDLVRVIREAGKKSGLVCWPATDASAVLPFLSLADKVSVMAVNPGQPGELAPGVIEKIKHIRRARDEQNSSALIQVDGAVSAKTRGEFLAAGAEGLVLGYPLFSEAHYGVVVKKFRDDL